MLSLSHSRSIKVLLLPLLLTLAALLPACTEPMTYSGNIDDPYRNFDELARIVSERYCFFRQKNVDWDALCREYRAQIKPDMTPLELFTLMSGLLDNLQDGHVNLNAPFATSYYKKWWSEYPQDFDERVLQEHYLHFGGLQKGALTYCIFLPDTVGYLRIPSFSSTISPNTLNYVLSAMRPAKGLIIDIRDNGGGMLTNISEVVSRFIDRRITAGYVRHKVGPGYEDFSEPFAIEYDPAPDGYMTFLDKPVCVLTNRSCFSAANDFVAVMKQLDNVRIVGARTGGGGGMPFSSELPNGWGIRFSACPINDSEDRITEFGIDPSPDCEMHCTPAQFALGKDAILDFAYTLLK